MGMGEFIASIFFLLLDLLQPLPLLSSHHLLFLLGLLHPLLLLGLLHPFISSASSPATLSCIACLSQLFSLFLFARCRFLHLAPPLLRLDLACPIASTSFCFKLATCFSLWLRLLIYFHIRMISFISPNFSALRSLFCACDAIKREPRGY